MRIYENGIYRDATPEEIAVDRELFDEGIRYHVYMRRRVTIMRLLPMLDIDPLKVYKSNK